MVTVTGNNQLRFNDHKYGTGYLELHWGASGTDPDDICGRAYSATGQQVRVGVPLV